MSRDRTAALRQARRRERQRKGSLVVKIEVQPAARQVLSEARWIGEWDEDDPKAVGEALQRLVDGLEVGGRR